MRCQVCDCNLSDDESTRKDEHTGQYLDICYSCMSNLYKDIDGGIPFDLADDFILVKTIEDDIDGS